MLINILWVFCCLPTQNRSLLNAVSHLKTSFVIPVQAGQNRQDRFWSAKRCLKGDIQGTIQSQAIDRPDDLSYLHSDFLDTGLRRYDDSLVDVHVMNTSGH